MLVEQEHVWHNGGVLTIKFLQPLQTLAFAGKSYVIAIWVHEWNGAHDLCTLCIHILVCEWFTTGGETRTVWQFRPETKCEARTIDWISEEVHD